MRHRVALLVLSVVLLGAPISAAAASSWAWAEGATYSEQAVGKLKFGATNTLLGWTSLFRTPMQSSRNGENIFVGIGKGVWNAVGQTVLGAAHLITFPITVIDVPLPEGGTDILSQ